MEKILFITPKSVWSGVQRYIFDLAVNLPERYFEIAIAAGGKGAFKNLVENKKIAYFEVKHFQKSINPLKEIFVFFELLKIYKLTQPDIIHLNGSKAGFLGAIAAQFYSLFFRRHPTKVIFTAHGWAFNEARPSWQIFLIKQLTKLSAIFQNKIICVSEYDKKAAIKNKIAPEKKIIIIHNSINQFDVKFFSKEEARRHLSYFLQKTYKASLENNDFIIGAIGEFTKNKGYSFLIRAAKEIINSLPYIKFIIIGWGEEKENLKSQIAGCKLQENIFLLDNIAPASQYLKAFDIFVLPSLKEGLPYVLLEAGLAKIPIVSTLVGGIPEIIDNKKNGFLVPAANIQELKIALLELAKDIGKRLSFSINLEKKLKTSFSFEKMLQQTIDVYYD